MHATQDPGVSTRSTAGAARARCPAWPLPLLQALLVALVMLAPGRSAAVTRIVGPNEDYEVIQEAIDDSEHGDIVLVRPSTYLESLTIERAITVEADGDGVIVSPPDTTSGIVRIRSGRFGNITTELIGLTLLGGHGWLTSGDTMRHGGAVLVDTLAIATLSGCTIHGSQADRGGAIAVWATASLTLRDAVIDSNGAAQEGGGLYVAGSLDGAASTLTRNTSGSAGGGLAVVAGGEAVLTDAVVDSNRAVEGGGGLWFAGSARLDSLVISDNAVMDTTAVVGTGGGIAVTGAGRVSMTRLRIESNRAARGGGIALAGTGSRSLALDSIVLDNLATERGGGIDIAEGVADSTVHLSDLDVSGNVVNDPETGQSVGLGGGIHVQGGFAVELDSLEVIDNAAELGGGLALTGAGSRRLSRSIVATNEAAGQGGGIYVAGDADAGTELVFLTIDGNLAPSNGGGGVHVATAAAVRIENSIITNHGSGAGGIACGGAVLAYNDRWNNDPENLAGCPLGTGSIVVDPQFVGGTPFDYSLRFNSPCIDAADPAAEVPPGGNERADIGAREFASGPLITSVTLDPDDPTQDGLYTSGDEIVLVVRGEAREPDLPTTVEADFDDVENGAYNPSSIDVTPLETTLPAFGYRVSYTIVQAAPNLDGAERSITVTATTAVGGTTTEVFTVLIDGRAPPPPVLDRPTDTNVTSDTFLVTGSAAGADSVLVFLNEEDEIPVARVATDASERFGITITLVEGDNTISAVAKDLAGNASAPAQLGVTVRYVAAFAIEFPKRFSPGDTFSISTLEPAPTIEIAIYNLAGQLIRSLRGGGSEHVEIVWDGANERGERVNAGPYLARIMIRSGASGEERTEHRALVLMKGVSQP